MPIKGISGAAGSCNPYDVPSSPQQSTFKALQSGNVSGARSAFARLTQDAKAAQGSHTSGHHHHHRGGGALSALVAALDQLSSATGSTTTGAASTAADGAVAASSPVSATDSPASGSSGSGLYVTA